MKNRKARKTKMEKEEKEEKDVVAVVDVVVEEVAGKLAREMLKKTRALKLLEAAENQKQEETIKTVTQMMASPRAEEVPEEEEVKTEASIDVVTEEVKEAAKEEAEEVDSSPTLQNLEQANEIKAYDFKYMITKP